MSAITQLVKDAIIDLLCDGEIGELKGSPQLLETFYDNNLDYEALRAQDEVFDFIDEIAARIVSRKLGTTASVNTARSDPRDLSNFSSVPELLNAAVDWAADHFDIPTRDENAAHKAVDATIDYFIHDDLDVEAIIDFLRRDPEGNWWDNVKWDVVVDKKGNCILVEIILISFRDLFYIALVEDYFSNFHDESPEPGRTRPYWKEWA